MNAHQATLWIHRVTPWIRCITPWTHCIIPWTHCITPWTHGKFLNLRDRNIKGTDFNIKDTDFFSRSRQMRGNLVHGGPWILRNTRGLYCIWDKLSCKILYGINNPNCNTWD